MALPGIHALTGCDTVSAFADHGKVSALKVASLHPAHRKLGDSWDFSDSLFKSLQGFNVLLYNSRSLTTDVNKLCYKLLCAKKGEADSRQLPLCEASLFKHCSDSCPDILTPIGHGWCLETDEEDYLAIDWLYVWPAPQAVLQLLLRGCFRKCELPTCACLVNNLKCSVMCRLKKVQTKLSSMNLMRRT